MSTLYASFEKWSNAKSAIQDLVNGGVAPDDLSLIVKGADELDRSGPILSQVTSVGDATDLVGRIDDPDLAFSPGSMTTVSRFTTTQMAALSPVDTSNKDTDVDSIDQMEDSQEEAENEASPFGGISHGEHEIDDLVLATTTGFPTGVPTEDPLPSGEFLQDEQNSDSLETIVVPGFGVIVGGGEMATAALEFAHGTHNSGDRQLIAHLMDEGVPAETAQELDQMLENQVVLMAVVVTPGELNVDALEAIVERHGGKNVGLFDSPRY